MLMLLDERAGVNAQDGYFGNGLQAASAEGRDKVLQILLEKEPMLAEMTCKAGSPLHLASAGGRIKSDEENFSIMRP